MKRVVSILLVLLMVACLLPMTIHAEESKNVIERLFPDGKISTPLEPYVVFIEDDIEYNKYFNTKYGSGIDIIYNIPTDLMHLADEIKAYDNIKSNKPTYASYFGISDLKLSVQVDISIDKGAWISTREWNEIDWTNKNKSDFPQAETAFDVDAIVKADSQGMYGIYQLSRIDDLLPSQEAFLTNLLITNEVGNTSYRLWNIGIHNVDIRMRYKLVYTPKNTSTKKVIFSDWTSFVTLSDDFNVQDIVKPTSIETPRISSYNCYIAIDDKGISRPCVTYRIDVPKSVYDGVLYYTYKDKSPEKYRIQTQMRINNGTWEDIETTDAYSVYSGIRDAQNIKSDYVEDDSIEIRARIYVDGENLYSAWSNVLGTTPYFTASTWAMRELNEANREGLIPTELYKADMTRPITRAEFAAVAVKVYESLSGRRASALSASQNPFEDCEDEEVLKAYKLNIVMGTSETTFHPDRFITREQAATMLTRAYKKIMFSGWTVEKDNEGVYKTEFNKKFSMPFFLFSDDEYISNWAKESVYFMYDRGIISGVGNNTFAPRAVTEEQELSGYGQCTREQALAIALRMVKRLDSEVKGY